MMTFFRRMINSRGGVIVSFLMIGIFALLFGLQGNMTGLGGGGPATGDAPIKVGKVAISTAELRSRIEQDYTRYQQQDPQLTLAQFVAGGGVDATVDSIINGLAIEQFARQQGMTVSDSYVKGILAASPAFQGPDGKYSQRMFDQYLAAQRTTYDELKQRVVQGALAQQIVIPTARATQISAGVALPYASLLLERRDGEVGLIPAKAIPAGAAPTDAELAAYYKRNIARYTVPERRAIRYAIVSPETVKAQATPSDAEIAAAYQKAQAKYAAAEKRGVTQVVVADQAAANAFAAKIKGGTSVADAAKAIGLSAATIKPVSRADYTAQTSPSVAAAVFAAAKGAVVGPVQGPLGYTIAKLDSVEQDSGKTLEQAKPEIAAALAPVKSVQALSKIHDALDDALNGKASFGDVVAAQKLTPVTTAPLTATGINPEDAASKPDPKLVQVIATAFASDPAEGPQMAQIDKDGSFAVVALDHIVAAAPRPLAQIRDQVAKDLTAERAEQMARTIAGQVVAALDKGTPFAQALAATKLSVPPVQKISAARAQLVVAGNRAPPPMVMLFSMGERTAKVLEAPDHAAYIVIWLAKVTPGNATGKPNVISGETSDLSKQVGPEYLAQFQKAVRGVVGVSKDDKAIASLKATLSGQGSSDQQ